MIHGPILTQCNSLDQVEQSIKQGGYEALKIVTGWGSPSGWNRAAMARVAGMVDHLVVRTVAGDPSYANGAKDYPIAEQVLAELGMWYTIRPDIIIELGNEPNIHPDWDEAFAWVYRWHLGRAVNACRAAFPKAKIIAPALILEVNRRPRRWLEIVADVMRRCDYIGIHAYEFDAFLAKERRHGTTGQLDLACQLHSQFFGGQPWILTEYGINDPGTTPAVKGQCYAAMVHHQTSTPVLPKQVVGALYYHLCFDQSLQREYHIAPTGDIAYRQERDRR